QSGTPQHRHAREPGQRGPRIGQRVAHGATLGARMINAADHAGLAHFFFPSGLRIANAATATSPSALRGAEEESLDQDALPGGDAPSVTALENHSPFRVRS